MIFDLLIGITFFVVIYGFTWAIIFLPTKFIVKEKYRKIIRISISMLAPIIIILYYMLIPVTGNDEIAIIQNAGNEYHITVTGEGLLMAHDPISALQRKTYKTSRTFVVPRQNGIIKGEEIPTEKGHYKLLGTMHIYDDSVVIDLYADNYNDKTKDPLSWNGKYKLEWRK